MADTRCTKCGETWEIDCLHEPDEYGLTLDGYKIVKCDACEWQKERGYPLKAAAETADALHEIMGDDIDGVVAMLQDAGY